MPLGKNKIYPAGYPVSGQPDIRQVKPDIRTDTGYQKKLSGYPVQPYIYHLSLEFHLVKFHIYWVDPDHSARFIEEEAKNETYFFRILRINAQLNASNMCCALSSTHHAECSVSIHNICNSAKNTQPMCNMQNSATIKVCVCKPCSGLGIYNLNF